MEAKRSNDDTLRSEDLETSLDVSNLLYLEKKTSNVITERSLKIQYADSPEYSSGAGGGGSELVVNFQTGSDFISSKDSFMRLVLNLYGADGVTPADGTITFGTHGTILNCFKVVRLLSRSGTVIAQTDASNLLNYYKLNYEHTAAWKTQQGEGLLGYKIADIIQGTEYIIPLQLISSFFESRELIPSQLCRSMRLEISLEIPSLAFQQTGAPVTALDNYTLSGVQVHLDSYSLTSGAVNWLNNRSANEGLVMTYTDYENSNFAKAAGQTSYSYEVRKTASMANSVATIFRNSGNQVLAQDSFSASVITPTDTYQYRIGSLYLPVVPVGGTVASYNQVNYSMDRLRSGQELGVTLGSFVGDLGMSTAVIDRYFLEGSGISLSNSTTLVISGSNDSVAAREVDMFLKHTRSLVIYLQNIRRSD